MIKKKKELSLDEIKIIELDILKEFIRLCDENNLLYSIAYGTMLGAVRHGGFIPWDDDIDVMMPRRDFYKLLECAKNNSKYPIISMFDNKDYFSPLAKMYDDNTILIQKYGQIENFVGGVYIDIFIIDGLPPEGQASFYSHASILRKKWGYSCRKFFAKHLSRNLFTDVIGSIVSIPYRIKGTLYYRDSYNSFCSKYDFYDCSECAVILFGEGLEKEKISVSALMKPITLTFEGLKVKSLNNPHVYLTNMYGNYMELPPLNKRVSKHPNVVFWKEGL